MRLIALVDYDNVRATPERTPTDAALNLEELVDRIVLLTRANHPDAEEIDLRLYGGWITEAGHYSRNAQWLMGALPIARGRRDGIRLKAHLVTNPVCQPSKLLIGTVRLRTKPVRQKMVDGLMTIDAIHLASHPEVEVLIISDDDDLIPCVLALRISVSSPLFVYRLRTAGSGLNDAMLSSLGVRLGTVRP